MVKKLCTCPLLDEISLLHDDFVSQVYCRPEHRAFRCARCGRRGAKSFARAILSTLSRPSENRSFLNLIRLRAAFWSITGNMHGTKDLTSFYIIAIEESSSGVLSTIFTEHDQKHELNTSKEEFLKMVMDPVLEIESTIKAAVEWVWRSRATRSVGGKAPRFHTNMPPMTLREFPCWCCDTKIRMYVREPEHLLKSTPHQDE
jgi:hypothetical protein